MMETTKENKQISTENMSTEETTLKNVMVMGIGAAILATLVVGAYSYFSSQSIKSDQNLVHQFTQEFPVEDEQVSPFSPEKKDSKEVKKEIDFSKALTELKSLNSKVSTKEGLVGIVIALSGKAVSKKLLDSDWVSFLGDFGAQVSNKWGVNLFSRHLAAIYENKGQNQKALDELRKVQKINKPGILSFITSVIFFQKQPEPIGESEILLDIGRLQKKLNLFKDAQITLSKIVEKKPNSEEAKLAKIYLSELK